jgi:murein DD-endopeptidase MepM/ murein hydrolase activator NlpD
MVIYNTCKYAYNFQIFAFIMKEKPSRNRIWNQLKKKYRFVIINDDSLEERASLRLTKTNMISLSFLFSLVFFIISFLIIVYSPLKDHLPGKSSEKVQKNLMSLTLKSDSFERALNIRDLYLNNIEAIIKGDSLNFNNYNDTINNLIDSEIEFTVSKEDSLLRAKVESEDQSSIALQTNKDTKYFLFYPPLDGVISDSYSLEKNHFATDIVAKKGTKIKCIMEGSVIISSWNPETGYVIGIQHANNYISFYKHCSRLLKKTGDIVSLGEYIAIIGNTGELSTGPHLHLELWQNGTPLNPENYISF